MDSTHKKYLDDCIACTSCVAHCPVTAATNKFRGPKMVGPALERFRMMGEEVEPSLEYCSNCKNCDITCPSGVPVSTMNMLAKAAYYRRNKHSLRDWILSHGEFMAKMSAPTAAMTNMATGNPLVKMVLKKIGISGKRALPRYAGKTFYKSFHEIKQEAYPDKVVFFPGCYINYNEPQVGLDLVKVLQKNQIEVIVPEGFVCCGSPLVVNGYLDEAEDNARRNVAVLQQWVEKGYPILTACTSCGLMLKQEYQELFSISGQKEMAAALYDSFEFLVELWEKGRLDTRFKTVGGKYMYHAPCHLRVQGIGRPALELLGQIPGLAIEDADAGCCGIAGNYGFKEDKYEISMAVGEGLFQRIKEAKPAAVISDCGTCRMQIAHGTGCKVMHPLSLLRQAYGE